MFNVCNKALSWKLRERKLKIELLKSRDSSYRSKFNISLEDYSKMFADQKGCCAICKQPQGLFKKRLSVDHCHKSLKVRKLLCNNCNSGLGLFKENKEYLKAAIEYLNENAEDTSLECL